ncbi:metal-sensitive transcriptional regulator [Acuticoccus mangrovi]|uniref:Metal-sensitive transcriptional regulator n=1 Tax=Acuticoccus mangrovi TaxID=2796142 RepID=A0A934IRM5_9HYPH|nr:metal-sensitive transcriptional regulator [Acuticoccus mangrovi]
MKHNRQKALARLKRIEGQVRGIQKMLEEDRYCVDVLTQTMAVRSALRGVERIILQDHADACIEHAIAHQDAEDQRQKFRELIDILNKFGS